VANVVLPLATIPIINIFIDIPLFFIILACIYNFVNYF